MGACRHRFLISLLCCTCWAGSAHPSAVQPPEPQAPLPARTVEGPVPMLLVDVATSEQRLHDLAQWIDDFTAWRRWNDEWRNRPEPGYFGVRERRPRPQPPEWLFSVCPDVAEDDGLLDKACRLLLAWSDNDPATHAQRQDAAIVARESPPAKSSWWQHLHLDTLWVMPQSGSSVYGVVGVHATVDITGRLQVFLAPGAMLMNLPTPDGGREWTPATHWGFALRLFDFRVPGTGRPATLHANVVKARVLAGSTLLGKSTLDLAGFSITLKKQ
jgi:hypothetical protein